jgi:hypothetical protein
LTRIGLLMEAAKEKDPAKLDKLAQEIIRLLDEKERRLGQGPVDK